MKFHVPGKRKIAYSGDIRVNLDHSGGFSAAHLLGGAAAGAIAGTAKDSGKSVVVENRFDEAKKEYRKRYEKFADQLSPFVAVASTPSMRTPAGEK